MYWSRDLKSPFGSSSLPTDHPIDYLPISSLSGHAHLPVPFQDTVLLQISKYSQWSEKKCGPHMALNTISLSQFLTNKDSRKVTNTGAGRFLNIPSAEKEVYHLRMRPFMRRCENAEEKSFKLRRT
jgi:hypothetical protein